MSGVLKDSDREEGKERERERRREEGKEREYSLIQPETTRNDVNSLVPWTLNTRHAFNDRNFTKASLRARRSFDNSIALTTKLRIITLTTFASIAFASFDLPLCPARVKREACQIKTAIDPLKYFG